MRFRNGAALGYAPAMSHQSQVSHAAPSFVNGFCMLYVHFCRSANTCAPGRRQPAGLPSTRGYAPHMRQAFFLGPAGGHFSTSRSAALPLQGGCAGICAAYIYVTSLLFSGVCAGICAAYIYAILSFLVQGGCAEICAAYIYAIPAPASMPCDDSSHFWLINE